MAAIVPPHELASVWPKVKGWIADAISHGQGDENLLDVLIAVARGQYLLWHEPEKFAGVVQVGRFPRQIVATILYCGGSDLSAMKAAIEQARPWCEANGIQAIRILGRKGWERVLDMTRKGVILQVDLARGALQ